MASTSSQNLVSAVESLQQEDKQLSEKIKALDSRRKDIRDAIGTINKLLGVTEPAVRLSSRTDTSNFASLSTPDAIRALLKETAEPLATPDIARGLLARGFKSGSDNFTNLVGVTLRRLEGKYFKRDAQNNWHLA